MQLPDLEPGPGQVLMLNMIKYKDRAHYFERYIPAFRQVVNELGINAKVVLLSNVVANILAPEGEMG